MFQQTPLLALLRRLEAQNIWRMSHNVLSAQPFSASAAAEAARGESSWVCHRRCRSGRPVALRPPVSLAAAQASRVLCPGKTTPAPINRKRCSSLPINTQCGPMLS